MKKFLILLLLIYSDSFSQYLMDKRINESISTYQPNTANFSINSNNDIGFNWIDLRDPVKFRVSNNIFVQRVNSFSNLIGNNILISINDSLTPSNPRILYLDNEHFWITWVDASATQYPNIRLRLYDSMGIPQNNLITLNDPFQITLWSIPVVIAKNQNFLISVLSYGVMPNAGQLYVQYLDLNGNKIGNNIKVNDDSTNNLKESPSVTVKKNGSFIISWTDKRESNSGAADIYMQMFDSQGNRIGVNKRVNDDTDMWIHQDKPSISSDSIGNFVIAWEDYRINDVYRNVFAQYFNSNGAPVGQNVRVDQGFTAWDRYLPKVAMSSTGNTVIAWTDDDASDPTTVYFRRYNPSFLPLGNIKKISNQAPQNLKVLNDCKMKGDRIMTVWTDNRNSGYDIYYNILSFQNPDSVISNVIKTSSNIPNKFHLYQNFPNPFNPITVIRYSLSEIRRENNFVSLKVYNIIGNEVATLVNQEQNPGSYSIEWDGTNFASGVYYYKLSTGENTFVMRMVLLK